MFNQKNKSAAPFGYSLKDQMMADRVPPIQLNENP